MAIAFRFVIVRAGSRKSVLNLTLFNELPLGLGELRLGEYYKLRVRKRASLLDKHVGSTYFRSKNVHTKSISTR